MSQNVYIIENEILKLIGIRTNINMLTVDNISQVIYKTYIWDKIA